MVLAIMIHVIIVGCPTNENEITENVYMTCRCRNCGAKYEESKSRADYKGYCGQACLHEKARKLGYKKSQEKYGICYTEYSILHHNELIGSIKYEL